MNRSFPPATFPGYLTTLVICMLLFNSMALPCHGQQIEQMTMLIKTTTSIDAAGNSHSEATLKFDPPRMYDRIKQAYPNLYILFRDLGNQRAGTEIDREKLSITSEDGNRTISFKVNMMSTAVHRTNGWQIPLDKNEDVVTQEGNKVFTSAVSSVQVGTILNMNNAYLLPAGAQNVKVDKQRHMLTYALPPPARAAAAPQIDFSVRFKKNLMASLYKIYADSEVGDGSYWVAKAIVKNTGQTPIYDVKISYKLGEYAEDGFSDTYTYVTPGGAAVDLYYPVIASKVVALRTRTPMRLHVKCEYKDAAGKIYEENKTENVAMLGINQFEFCNLDEEDKTDSWKDNTNNAPLIAAYVTKLDEPVKKFAGYISQLSGGAPASINNEGAKRWLKAAYNLQLMNKFVYQTPSSALYSQDLKYPRDVFAARSGTCIDLAIMYASLAESVGLHSYLMFIPGHCFAVVVLPNGELMPVENTGIGGGDNHMTFDEANIRGVQEFNEHINKSDHYLIDVEKEQNEHRIPVPELTKVDDDFLEKSNILPADRLGAVRDNAPAAPRSRVGMGFFMENVPPDKRQMLKIEGGVMIPRLIPDGPAEVAGLQVGDIIVSMDKYPIGSPQELVQTLGKFSLGQKIVVSAYRGSEKRDFDVVLVSVEEAAGFGGTWDGVIGQLKILLVIKQDGHQAEGTLQTFGSVQSGGDFRKAALRADGSLQLHARLEMTDGSNFTMSVDLQGTRTGNHLEGTGKVVFRNALGVEQKKVNVVWSATRR